MGAPPVNELGQALCMVEGCGKRMRARGYCVDHYQSEWLRGRTLDSPGRRMWPGPCRATGCDRVPRSGGWCPMHYRRIQLHGTPDLPSDRHGQPPPSLCSCGETDPTKFQIGVYDQCRVCRKALSAERQRQDHANGHWRRRIKSLYGLTEAEYESMRVGQNGKCATCRNPETVVFRGTVSKLSVDHDHETGVVRGLLCRRCNTVLGHVRDDPELLLALMGYLMEAEPE